MIWTKTDAGRAEMQTRAVVKERVQRTLLLLVDGSKSEQQLLASVDGTQPDDFKRLEALGLIAAVAAPPRAAARDSAAVPLATTAFTATAAPVAAPADYAQFTAALTQIISKELGLRGFPLTLAVEKAGTIEDLQAVAQRTIEQIRGRKGEPAAAAARRTLYGG